MFISIISSNSIPQELFSLVLLKEKQTAILLPCMPTNSTLAET